LPFHRLVPLPGALPSMRMAASWLWVQDSTEYKVVALDQRPRVGSARKLFNINVGHQVLVDWECSGSRLALTRARSAATALTHPRSQSLWLVIASAQSADSRR
jgi:hypothetical protein